MQYYQNKFFEACVQIHKLLSGRTFAVLYLQDPRTMHSWVFFCFALMFLSASVNGFGGADDRYIKKYAMMKVITFLHISLFLKIVSSFLPNYKNQPHF